MTHIVDAHVGDRLRHRRLVLGLSQVQLAEMIGVSFQQLQKYEQGKNRISASRIWEIAQAMEVPVGFFFEGLAGSKVREWTSNMHDSLNTKNTIELVRAYRSMPEAHRASILNLTKSLARVRTH